MFNAYKRAIGKNWLRIRDIEPKMFKYYFLKLFILIPKIKYFYGFRYLQLINTRIKAERQPCFNEKQSRIGC